MTFDFSACTRLIDQLPHMECETLKQVAPHCLLIDVRRPEEFTGELGHIEGSHLAMLGPDLVRFLLEKPKQTPIVFICRSGARSASATEMALQMGFQKVANLNGGMIRWNELSFEVER